MKQLAIALKTGFAAEREERLSRWALIRDDEYWKPWLQRDIPLTILVAIFVAVSQQSSADPLVNYIWIILIVSCIFAPLHLIAEMHIWRNNENQWKAWRRKKEAEDASSNGG